MSQKSCRVFLVYSGGFQALQHLADQITDMKQENGNTQEHTGPTCTSRQKNAVKFQMNESLLLPLTISVQLSMSQ